MRIASACPVWGVNMRITKKVFTDLTIYMIFLGVCVGLCFPFFMVLFEVPKAIVLKPSFFAACIGAGILLALMNIWLARRVVGNRMRQLSQKMKHVEGILSKAQANSEYCKCTAENCLITVDSEDELGESAESFNQLITTLSEVLEAQESLQCFSQVLTSHLELDTLANQALRNLAEITQANGGAVLVENNGELTLAAALAMKNARSLATNALVLNVLQTRERYLIRLPENFVLDGLIAEYSPKEIVIEPIVYKQVLRGVIVLAAVQPFSQKTLDQLTAYAPILSMAFNNAITHQQMEALAALDPLTGVYNRRFGNNRMYEEFSRSVRSGAPLSLIMADIDHFKIINDTYGHTVGDKIIVQITKTISQAIRDGDVLIRYGGEEFLCVLSGASQHDANMIAERIRVTVSDSVLRLSDQEIRVTVSLGTATYPNCDISDIQQLVVLVDEALYTAKNTGRNRVVSV